jgi:hypothetical protein
LLIDSVVTDAELNRKNHDSIRHNCDQRRLKPYLIQELAPESN